MHYVRYVKCFYTYFCDNITMSDHTPYNFPHGNGEPQHFNIKMISHHITMLIKPCQLLSQKTTMPKGVI